VSGSLYEPNKLTFSGNPSDNYNAFTLHVDLANYTEIVALQFDIHGLAGMAIGDDGFVLASRASGHSASAKEISAGVHRVVVYSLNNMAFAGNSGRIFDLTFSGASCRNGKYSIDNIKLSNADGVDYTSPNASVDVGGNVNVIATSITLDQTSASVVVDKTLKLTATVNPSNVANKAVTWSSSDESVATVDETGLVTAHKVGSTSITVTTTDGSNLTATCALTVTPQLVESIELSQAQLLLNIGDEYTLEAVVLPDNATDKSVVWTTSDSTIVSVKDGVIIAIAVGTATITVTAADDSNVYATCEVEVTKMSGITDIFSDKQTSYNIYMLNGVLVKSAATAEDVKNLTTGFYIINGKKIFIKKNL
jgi:uncharacterized protein YjdB